jgi:quinol-cytochrome oxidoreductase complex cytochrome b subunit
MESTTIKRRRWNLIGFIASIISTFALLGLIIYGQEHKGQLEIVFSVLVVILIVAFFAVIRQRVKRIINNKLNKDRNE